MAGSYEHCCNDDGSFRFDLIENMGDAYEACEDMHARIADLEQTLNECDVLRQRGYTVMIERTGDPVVPYLIRPMDRLDASEEHVLSLERERDALRGEVERLRLECQRLNECLGSAPPDLQEAARREGAREACKAMCGWCESEIPVERRGCDEHGDPRFVHLYRLTEQPCLASPIKALGEGEESESG